MSSWWLIDAQKCEMTILSSHSHRWKDQGLLTPSPASSHCLWLTATCLWSLRNHLSGIVLFKLQHAGESPGDVQGPYFGKDQVVTFPFYCSPREMLVTDHNLKISFCDGAFQILECQRVSGKLIKYAEFLKPPPELLIYGGLWRDPGHTFANKSPKKFWCGPME